MDKLSLKYLLVTIPAIFLLLALAMGINPVYLDLSPGKVSETWTIYFDISGNGNLVIQNLTGGINFSEVYYYNNGWYNKPYSLINNSAVNVSWGSHEKGKIVFDVLEYGKFSVKFDFNGLERYTQNHDYYNQVGVDLNLNTPSFNFLLCSYNSTNWVCDPSSDESGYFGETYNFSEDIIKYFEIPNTSTANSFNLIIKSLEGEPIKNFTYSGNRLLSVDFNGEDYLIITSTTDLKAINSSGEEVWNYTTSSEIKDVSSGDVNGDTKAEIVVATSNKLIILSGNGTELKNITRSDLRLVDCGDLLAGYSESKQDDGNPETVSLTLNATKANFTLPYSNLTDK
ncbi:MAG: hypothetical protein KAU95_02495, partial [Candidatus Aenigmarchaeota archaeon]|nr:hypothetical protein [Candidatus Aenigmarchaeota archaeon]